MSDTPSMQFRKLEPDEIELAVNLAGSVDSEDPEAESFGGEHFAAPLSGEGWGLWMAGVLSGVALLAIPPGGGIGEVKSLILLRGWRRLGLAEWMLEELSSAAARAGCNGINVQVKSGGTVLGSILDNAGFIGPSAAEPDYPIGRWSKLCR